MLPAAPDLTSTGTVTIKPGDTVPMNDTVKKVEKLTKQPVEIIKL